MDKCSDNDEFGLLRSNNLGTVVAYITYLPDQAELVMAEIHEGECGNHSGGRRIKLYLKGTFGHICRQMPEGMSANVISASDTRR